MEGPRVTSQLKVNRSLCGFHIRPSAGESLFLAPFYGWEASMCEIVTKAEMVKLI